MHASVMWYVGKMIEYLDIKNDSVLEVGSYDVNGSVRGLFAGEFVGSDMRAGPGVDVVAPAADLPFDDKRFDVVVSTEMLEHDTLPWLSIAEMVRVVRPGGVLILTARGYDERGCFPVHDFPADHWRFSVGGMVAMLEHLGLQGVDARADPEAPGVFACAKRPGLLLVGT